MNQSSRYVLIYAVDVILHDQTTRKQVEGIKIFLYRDVVSDDNIWVCGNFITNNYRLIRNYIRQRFRQFFIGFRVAFYYKKRTHEIFSRQSYYRGKSKF